MRLRDGDREVEVSGDAAFVRAVLDELPTLLGRLAQPPASPRRADVTMPPPPPAAGAPAEDRAPRAQREAPPNASSRGDGRIAGANLEDRVLRVLRTADQPLSIAAIRERLGEPVSGQQVRRILERAPLVDASGDRPAAYSIR